MLTEVLATFSLKDALLSRDQYKPYPAWGDRAAWEALPEAQRAELIQTGEKYLGYQWLVTPATYFMDFARNGNRLRYETAMFAKRMALEALALAECAEGKGRFLDDIINGVWAQCEETFWGVSAHKTMYKNPDTLLPDPDEHIVDLFASESGMLLAFVWALLKEPLGEISPLVPLRMLAEVDRRIITPILARRDFMWMGYELKGHRMNNWNPWIYSNFLVALLLMEADPVRREAGVRKACEGLDMYLAAYDDDGGCEEGPNYWDRGVGALYDALEPLCCATGGRLSIFDQTKIADMGKFIYRMHIGGDVFVNHADGSVKPRPTASILHGYGKATGDAALMGFGAYIFALLGERRPEFGGIHRQLRMIFTRKALEQTPPAAPMPGDVWLPDLQVMLAREKDGSADGLVLAAKGGHNGVSHNHNDVGTFTVYLDGDPLIVDAGVGEYTKETFGPNRYGLWTMRSAYHCAPMVRGVEQQAGERFRAEDVRYEMDADRARVSMELKDAYPAEAGIASWTRRMALERSGAAHVAVTDDFALTSPAEVRVHLLLARRPSLSAGDVTLYTASGREAALCYNDALYAIEVEEVPIGGDVRMAPVWGEALYRLALVSRGAVGAGRAEVSVRAGK